MIGPDLARAYHSERQRGVAARHALAIARHNTTPLALAWTSARNGDDVAEWTADPFTLRATIAPDYDAPELWAGGIIDGWPDDLSSAVLLEPHDMRTARDWPNYHSRRPRWYVSDYTLAERLRDHSRAGESRSVARERARAELEDEARYQTADDRAAYVVRVEVYAEGIELASSAVGAFEPAEGWTAAHRDAEEIINDIAPDALDEARATLARLVALA